MSDADLPRDSLTIKVGLSPSSRYVLVHLGPIGGNLPEINCNFPSMKQQSSLRIGLGKAMVAIVYELVNWPLCSPARAAFD
jgi:hypothetical protein